MAVILLCFFSCSKKLKPASVIVVDPVRHYYPVLQGEMMSISYEIENTSDNPLFIQEIQTTCGCLVPKNQLPVVVLPHKCHTYYIQYHQEYRVCGSFHILLRKFSGFNLYRTGI